MTLGSHKNYFFEKDMALYRARNLVERFFNKIKQCRRVATRYDKLAANYLGCALMSPRPKEKLPSPPYG